MFKLMVWCIIFVTLMQYSDVAANKTDRNCRGDGCERILSRQRRYLTFPAGSSLQLVYDQTIPIVALPLVFTVGITVALAWELPSKTLSEINKEIRERLKDGDTLLRIDKNSTANTLIDSKKPFKTNQFSDYRYPNLLTNYYNGKQPSPIKYNNYKNSNYNTYGSNRIPSGYGNKVSAATTNSQSASKLDYYLNRPTNNSDPANRYYFGGNNLVRPISSIAPSSFSPPLNSNSKWTINDWMNVINKYAQYRSKNTNPEPSSQKHRIMYPVYGKRSIRNPADKSNFDWHETEFFRKHHRQTRHELYSKIENFLMGNKKDGRSCLLKALCETGQRRANTEPGPFLAEIMRAVFTLPTTTAAENKNYRTIELHRSYDEAHSSNDNCVKKYSKCKDSLWSSDFMM